MGKVKRW